jgi:hypothetical protein
MRRYAINEKEVAFRVLDDGAVIVHYDNGYYTRSTPPAPFYGSC